MLESSTRDEKFLKIQRCPRSLPSLMLLIWYAYLVISNNIWFLLYLQCRRLLLFTSSSLNLPQQLYSAFHRFKTYCFLIFSHVQQPANTRIKPSCQGLWLDAIGSTVQKAVVVLAAKPVFGPIRYVRTSIFSFSRILFLSRDKLHVVTSALSCKGVYVLWLWNPKCTLHRDFSDASILDDFEASLERTTLCGQLTDSGLYMGMFFTFFFSSLLTSKLFRDKSVGIIRLPYVIYHGIKAYLTGASWFIGR